MKIGALIEHYRFTCAQLRSDVEEIRKTCQHNHVLHWNGNGNYSPTYPRRICLDCRLEEEGGWWASIHSWRDGLLRNHDGQTVTVVSDQELYKHRLPF